MARTPSAPSASAAVRPWAKLVSVLLVISYSTAVVAVTDHFIAARFEYQGYVAREWISTEAVSAGAALVLLALTNPSKWHKPSQVAYTFLLATVACPVVTIPMFWGPLDTATLLKLHFATMATFVMMRLSIAGNPAEWNPIRLTADLYWAGVGLSVLVGLLYLILSTGISPTALSLSDVYAQRSEFTSNVTSIGAYLVGWIGAGTLPLVLAAGLYRRDVLMTLCASTGIIALYSITGYKSYLVGIMLTITAFFLTQQRFRSGNGWFVTLGAAIAFSAAFDYATNGFAMSTLIVRRALSTAGINTALFFEFFDGNDKYELRHSVFSVLGSPPYDLSPGNLIGLVYYGSPKVAANANLIADGYANFGILGCAAMGVAFGLYLRFFDKASAHLPLQISAPGLTLVLVAAANTAALTVMSTHGGIVALIVALLMPPATRAYAWRRGTKQNGAFSPPTSAPITGRRPATRRRRR